MDSASSLPSGSPNASVNDTIDPAKFEKVSIKTGKCNICQNKDEVVRCKNCKVKFCSTCQQNNKVYMGHRVAHYNCENSPISYTGDANNPGVWWKSTLLAYDTSPESRNATASVTTSKALHSAVIPSIGQQGNSTSTPVTATVTQRSGIRNEIPQRPEPVFTQEKLLTAAARLTFHPKQQHAGTDSPASDASSRFSPMTPPVLIPHKQAPHNQGISNITQQLLSYERRPSSAPGKPSGEAFSDFQPQLPIRSRTSTPAPSRFSSVVPEQSQIGRDGYSPGLFVSRENTPINVTPSVTPSTERDESSKKSNKAHSSKHTPSEREIKQLLADSIHNVHVFGQPLGDNTRMRKKPERYMHSNSADHDIGLPVRPINTGRARPQAPGPASTGSATARRLKRTASSTLDPSNAKRVKVRASNPSGIAPADVQDSATPLSDTDLGHTSVTGDSQAQAVQAQAMQYNTSSSASISRPKVQIETIANNTATVNQAGPAGFPQNMASRTKRANVMQTPLSGPSQTLVSHDGILRYRNGAGQSLFLLKPARGYKWQRDADSVAIVRDVAGDTPKDAGQRAVARINRVPGDAPFQTDLLKLFDERMAPPPVPHVQPTVAARNLDHIPLFVPPVPPSGTGTASANAEEESQESASFESQETGTGDDEGSLYEE